MSSGAASRSRGPLRGILWLAAAVLLSLSVLAINGVPLYYFDSVGYKLQGDTILEAFIPGLAGAGEGAGGGSGGFSGDGGDKRISVARSGVYAVIVATAWIPASPFAVPILHLLAVLLTAAFCARVTARAVFGKGATLTMVGAPVAIASATALPFYVAYVMPDVFAGLAILVIALVVAFPKSMTKWDFLLALAILGFAVVVHRSHLVIVGLAVPVAGLALILTGGRRGLMAAALIAVAAVAGMAELKTYSAAAERASGKVASINPFLSARIIADGPGYAYLSDHCPDDGIATCRLFEVLERSDDPARLDAANIIFERTEGVGSFKFLSEDDQIRIGREQRRFYVDVFLDRPMDVLLAITRNTLRQTSLTSVHMTVPSDATVDMLRRSVHPDIEVGRLQESRKRWLPPLRNIHNALYAASLFVIAVICVVPGLATRELRFFAGFVIVGILINAFVCGAVSQPAARYGARVIWLLPFVATILTLASIRLRAAQGGLSPSVRGEPAE